MMAFFLFQRCGEILFENPDQNVKCVCMLGKKSSHFKSIKHVDVSWTYCHCVALLANCLLFYVAEANRLFFLGVDSHNTFIGGTLSDEKSL